MSRENFNDLIAFLAVAREHCFTRAAAQLGVSQSALSHAIRALETRLGIRLLTRTTRSVSPTEAGERLLQNVAPRFDETEAEMAALSELRDKPAGKVRITCAEHAANCVLWPTLSAVLPDYPEVKVEVVVDYGLVDIVAGRFDLGVRLGDQVAKDMIAVRISPDFRMAVVGTPVYFDKYPAPLIPQDLAGHMCINMRLPTYGGIAPWEIVKDGQTVNVRVDGQLIYNSVTPRLRAALAGFGLAIVPANLVLEHIAEGRLIHVLDEWCAPFPGYHVYYPSRRQASPALSLLKKLPKSVKIPFRKTVVGRYYETIFLDDALAFAGKYERRSRSQSAHDLSRPQRFDG